MSHLSLLESQQEDQFFYKFSIFCHVQATGNLSKFILILYLSQWLNQGTTQGTDSENHIMHRKISEASDVAQAQGVFFILPRYSKLSEIDSLILSQ